MIRKVRNKELYVLKSKNGTKVLGKFKSRKAALKREKQINFFKSLNK